MIWPKKTLIWLPLLIITLLCSSVSYGTEIPEPLKPWVPWVMHGQDDRFCTSSYDGEQRFCVWPEPLVMDLHGSGGIFEQSWQMKREGWIILPGQEKHWPRQVVINGDFALVVSRNGRPAIHVEKSGGYEVSGIFEWERLPESITVPGGTAIVRLKVNGGDRLADISGTTLWLSDKSREKQPHEQDTVHTQVYRLIKDSIPMVITSRIEVQVSGKPREILLDWQLPQDQIPLQLTCSLPVKIGTDGRIHMQAGPGTHSVFFQSRPPKQVESLLFDRSNLGPDTEYWSFEARNQLRMVKIGGDAAPVDPSQTTIPGEWHSFPAYLMKKGTTFAIETLKRGNPEPPPNNLVLNRMLWLDGDGGGITVQDSITGTIHRKPRLEMQPPAELGRMVINGRDQLITRLHEDGPEGVEVRQGRIEATAVSKLDGSRNFPAGGWDNTIHRLSAELNLPPGWKLFYASGVDSARTWVSQWTLLDCFVVLIVVISTFKLLGTAAGCTALVALVLSYHDQNGPVYIWLALLACTAVIRAIPESKFFHHVSRIKLALLVGLVIVILPYSVEQLRIGFFPQLERIYQPYSPPAAQIQADGGISESMPVPHTTGRYAQERTKAAASALGLEYEAKKQLEQQYHTQSKVQAGPGVPNRKWRIVRLNWNGPVDKDLQLNLILLSPLVSLVLALLKVAAVFLLAFFMLDRKRGGPVKFQLAESESVKAGTAALLLLSLFFTAPSAHCSTFPSPELLDSLRTRLTEPARCFPDCADLDTMRIDLQETDITVTLNANSSTESAVMMPQGQGIFWYSAEVDGTQSPIISDNETLWIGLPKGRSEIRLTGRVNRSDVQMRLPHRPHVVVFDGHEQWTAAGLDVNGVPDERLQFVKRQAKQENENFGTSTLPPLMQVKRILHLGLQWRVETIVTRLSTPGTSVFLSIPLLAGESVTNPEYTVENGEVAVKFGPNEQRKRWNSVFEITPSLTLTAPDTTDWYEIWQLNASPAYHIEANGFAPIHHHSQSGTWQPEWHPWPREKVTFTVIRPKGVPGPTKSIDSSSLQISPGLRSTSMHLEFAIRSTRGDQQLVMLPEDAVIQSVKVNGREQPVKKDRTVVIPLSPGSQQVAIDWRTPEGITTIFQVPEIDLGSDSVNSSIEIRIGKRWVWFVKGPKMGPAVLFYSELLIILLVSIILGRSKLTPLKSHHWLILGLGLCQSGLIPSLIIAAWFIALKIRLEKGRVLTGAWFNLAQVGLAALTVTAIGALVFAVQNGLLGHPDMLIAGNDSSSFLLRWYQDRMTGTTLPQPMVVSIPMMAYRGAMLAWALWTAFHLLRWVKWGWGCFTETHIWQTTRIGFRRKKKEEDRSE